MPNDSHQIIASRYLSELRNPRKSLTPQAVSHYSQQAISLFFEYFDSQQMPLREAIDILCEVNMLQDSTLSRIGLEALFPHLIEQLNDSFEPAFSYLYDRLFAQVISFCRQLKAGAALDALLNDFGLSDETAILLRKMSWPKDNYSLTTSRPIKKLFFLSRITIGADIAITSVMISHLKKVFPEAEIVLVGPSKLNQLFGGDDRIRVKPIEYGRNSNLLSRLLCWQEVVYALNDEIVGLSPYEYYIFDPDSRLTQLGILPLLSPQHEKLSYFLFESRNYSHPGLEKLGQLTSRWLQDITGVTDDALPFISLPQKTTSIGIELAELLRSDRNQPLTCLSFGVGGNQSKRISLGFEQALANNVVKYHKLFIDCGSTDLEYEQANLLLSSLESQGKSILRLNENSFSSYIYRPRAMVDVIAWQGGIGSFASLISSSDQYIGYDSSGQHIAAALGVPTFTIFVNSGSQTFARRWQPHGSTNTQVLQLDPTQTLSHEVIVTRVLQKVFSSD